MTGRVCPLKQRASAVVWTELVLRLTWRQEGQHDHLTLMPCFYIFENLSTGLSLESKINGWNLVNLDEGFKELEDVRLVVVEVVTM